MNLRILTFIALGTLAWSFSAQANNAKAELESKNGSSVKGTVKFKETQTKGLEVDYNVTGLTPNQAHGFHIHEKADCSSADAKSAGGHYAEEAPTGGTSLDTPQKYAGDLPQLIADDKGVAKGKMYVKDLSIHGDHSILNHAVVVHDGPDNPSMKSPPRIACGEIRGKTNR